MGAIAVIEALTEAAKAGMELYQQYEAGKIVLSETDANAVHQALLAAEAATAALRPMVDAALDAAAKK
jgi:hypothetical protein